MHSVWQDLTVVRLSLLENPLYQSLLEHRVLEGKPTDTGPEDLAATASSATTDP
jgi:hypothetical protein